MQFIEAPSQEKKNHLERMLIKGGVMIFIDARRKKLQLPAHLLGNPQLPLNLDYAFQIPDFNILEDRVEASLSFNRQSFFCIIPLNTIYALRSHVMPEVIVFPEDVPKDFTPLSGQVPGGGAAGKKPKLIAVEGAEKKKTEEKKPTKKNAHLKLVT